MYDYIVAKASDRKILDHQDFEHVCSKYW